MRHCSTLYVVLDLVKSHCLLFQVLVASHIRDLYLHAESERVSRTPGVATPVRKRPPLSSQTQFVPDPTLTASSVSFAQQRIENELTDKLFR